MLMRLSRTTRFAALFAGLFLALSMIAIDHAEARRGGSFGSRGTRTFQSAPATPTAPKPTAPVERSMTPDTAKPGAAASQSPVSQQRPGFLNGFGGSMLRGLLLGGLIGALLGYGFGGLAGVFGFLLQALLIGGALMLLLRFFRSQRAPQPAMAGNAGGLSYRDAAPRNAEGARAMNIPSVGYGGADGPPLAPAGEDIRLTQADLDTFERRLGEVQEAFGREDHAALRRLVTPEMVSYLSEELAQNARNGLRNDVSDVTLHQADIAEAWREGDVDFATAALRYSSHDVTLDRATGKVVEGDADQPTETTEVWTFVRRKGDDWKLSAIQET
jgi:predicted lipid-binding transport protein (Tim44 family)